MCDWQSRGQHHSPVEKGQELVLVVALQAVRSHGAEDGPDTPDAQCSCQEPSVEQNLLLPWLQLVSHMMSVYVEVLEWESHHWEHGCS